MSHEHGEDRGRPLTPEETKKVEDAGTQAVYRALKALGLEFNGRLITVRVMTLGRASVLAEEVAHVRQAADTLRAEVLCLADMIEQDGPMMPTGRRITYTPDDPGCAPGT